MSPLRADQSLRDRTVAHGLLDATMRMRMVARTCLGRWLLVAAFAIGGAAAPGCGSRSGVPNTGGGGMVGGVGGVGGAGPGTAGAGGGVAAACTGPGDPRLVVASQRILRLTSNETLN